MTPYYQDGGITIYHADCRDVLPTIDPDDVALVLTDPPYGMNHEPSRRGTKPSRRWGAERVIGDKQPFDPAHLLRYRRLVLFGAQWYADKLPASGGWIVWDKTPLWVREGFSASHADLAWTNCCGSIRKFSLQWGGGAEAHGQEPHLHPTQKPVAIMRWILQQFTRRGDLVLDPYMGSGPVAEACRQMDRRYIGVELLECYCAVAVGRMSQGFLFGEVS